MALSCTLCCVLPFNIMCIIVAALVVASAIIVILSIKQKHRLLLFTFVGPIIVFIGYFGVYYSINVAPVLKLDGQTANIYAKVCDIPKDRDNYIIYKVKVISSDNKNVKEGLKLSCITSNRDSIEMYDYVTANVTFYETNGKYKLYNYADGIYISSKTQNFEFLEYGESDSFVMQKVYELRKSIKSFIELSTQKREGGVIEALTIADSSKLSSKTLNSFRVCGLSHMLVISGFHLSLIFLGLFNVIRKCGLSQRPSAIICLILAFLYTALVGFGLSVVRAFVAFATVMLGYVFYRKPDILNSLGCAAVIILFINPYSISDIGFLLSASSLLGIITVSKILIDRFTVRTEFPLLDKTVNKMSYVFLQSLGAIIFIFPIMILYYSTFSVLAPVINVLMFLPITVITILSVIGVILGVIPFLSVFGKVIIDLAEFITKYTLDLAEYISGLNFISVNIKAEDVILPLALIFIFLGISFLVFREKFRMVLAVFTSVLVIIFSCIYGFSKSNNKIAFINSSFCSAIIEQDTCVVIGSGEDYYDYSDLAEFLEENNVRKINALIIPKVTREAAGGLPYIISNFECENVIIDTKSEQIGTYSEFLSNTKVIDIKGVELAFSSKYKITTHKAFDSYIIELKLKNKMFAFSYDYANLKKYGETFKKIDVLVTDEKVSTDMISDENTLCIVNSVENSYNKVYNCNRVVLEGETISADTDSNSLKFVVE